jgi:hypothetical protein
MFQHSLIVLNEISPMVARRWLGLPGLDSETWDLPIYPSYSLLPELGLFEEAGAALLFGAGVPEDADEESEADELPPESLPVSPLLSDLLPDPPSVLLSGLLSSLEEVGAFAPDFA